MERFVKKFWTEEDGNTTVDWMVLTAGLVLLGAAVMASVGDGGMEMADTTSVAIEDVGTNAGL